MEKKTADLYIPDGIKDENEIFDGFGARELRRALPIAFAGLAFCALLYIVTGSQLMTGVSAMVCLVASVLFTVKDGSNQSFADHLANFMRFARGQKVFPYRYMDEWHV